MSACVILLPESVAPPAPTADQVDAVRHGRAGPNVVVLPVVRVERYDDDDAPPRRGRA